MARGLTERYQQLSNQLDKVIHDANVEVARLQDKVARLTTSEEDLRKKNHELMEGWREKGRKLAQTQVRQILHRF
jgi:E3 ubiquitin-protein ligase CCNP1IP1